MSRASLRPVAPPVGAVDSRGLQRVVVMVADESLKTRTLLGSILASFGIGKVVRAVDGANALELIHEMRRHPERVGVTGIDLLISEWDMARVGGAELLRWVRHHRDSPDRFLPFIAMSAAPLEEQVTAARDLGANQFMARPYTVNGLCEHIDSLIRDDRIYVKTPDYFGPDRRLHDRPVATDRRADGGTKPAGVRFVPPPRGLTAKVGGRFRVEPEMLAKAEGELETWQQEFSATAQGLLDRLASEFAAIRSTDDALARHAALGRIGLISHQLHGHGHCFGFPMVTSVSRALHELASQSHDVGDELLGLVGAHIDTIRAVLSTELRSDGGKIGRELVGELQRANRKYLLNSAPRYTDPP